jgi:hypothetical protein
MLPDFSQWSTERLKFLLANYRPALQAARKNRNHAEIVLYDTWVKGMEAELKKREE